MTLQPGRALFLTDANRRIGAGHLVRCRLIAHELCARGWECRFLLSQTSDVWVKALQEEGFGVSEDVAVDDELCTWIDTLFPQQGRRTWLITDTDLEIVYTVAFQRAVKAIGFKLMTITMWPEYRYDGDVVLNPNIMALEQSFDTDPRTRLLLGPEYAMLNRSFVSLRPSLSNIEPMPSRLLLTFGGGDPRRLTQRAIAAVESAPCHFEDVDVVVGSMYSELDSLNALLAECTTRMSLHVQTPKMADLMQKADMALTSGGSVTWELACMGVPHLIVSSSEREKLTAVACQRKGLCQYVGHWDSVKSDDMATALSRIFADEVHRVNLAVAGRQYVDGRGLDRIVSVLEEQDL